MPGMLAPALLNSTSIRPHSAASRSRHIAHGLPVAHVEGKGDGRVLRVQPKRFDKFPCRRFEAFRRPRDQGYL